ncbi:MAG: UDP-N-acetylmuramoyl-L-alanyl-D-glutamate--2,6-diaminopimelate ligase [Proteobacteria bacterium]|nr:UDP-N-acetylmuramoyl-L-alanyl-D-glutamate--2,6-diaminopimelate ligase [Pseudomonadota bacterium]
MKLFTLIEECEASHISGNSSVDIKGISEDSRRVKKNFLFVAINGEKSNGHDFLDDAVEKGAAALMTQEPHRYDGKAVSVSVANSKKALGLVSARFYGEPSKKLKLVGITGTNGKTTITYLLESILGAARLSPGVIGTVNARYEGQVLNASHTTPAPTDLQRILSEMVHAGTTHCIMEVSSHALDQERVSGCNFDTVIFTNLTRDHLDYHGTMEDYGKAKERLFLDLPFEHKKAVINIDDPFGKLLAGKAGHVITYGLKEGDICPAEIKKSKDGFLAKLNTPAGMMTINSTLVGQYNLYNIMASIGAAISLGIGKEMIEDGIEALKKVPGRLERISLPKGFEGCRVFVDYAHTPDALARVIEALRSTTTGRLITLFGCGGDRDKEKRAIMGKASSRGSDFTIVTSDNPRSEDPQLIVNEIENGVVEGGGERGRNYSVIIDRHEAILEAAKMMKSKDTLLIAGKGHEDYQILGNSRIYFDDRVEAAKAFSSVESDTKAA